MSDYLCKTCGLPAPHPLWLLAREKGFDAAKHCMVQANAAGIVVPCVMADTGPMCDACAVGKALGVGRKVGVNK